MNTLTPQAALERLIQGNQRFTSGVRSIETMLAHKKMPILAAQGQRPFAIVLTCSDSRSPVEMIFDEGLGDLFVVRVAGNVVAPSLIASVEFAAANFGSSLVLVLGHTKCGAVDATIKHRLDPSKPMPSAHLEELVGRIVPAVEASQREMKHDHPEFLDHAIVSNVKRSQKLLLEQSTIISSLANEGKLAVRGGILDISTGTVRIL